MPQTGGPWKRHSPLKLEIAIFWHSMLDFWGVHFVKLTNSRLNILLAELAPKRKATES